MEILKGIAVSSGIAIGPVVVFDQKGLKLPALSSTPFDSAFELDRLDRSLEAARIEANQAEAEARSRLGSQYADILMAHASIISDPALRRESRDRIERRQLSAEHAVNEVLESYIARLEKLADPHLAARAADVRDIRDRILFKLFSEEPRLSAVDLKEPALILAHDLAPSEAARLDPKSVPGFATEVGGGSSHTAIVAAALEIPAVVGLGRFLDRARGCRMAIIDGDEGLVILDPDPATQERYRRAARERSARFEVLAGQSDLPAVTPDGTRVELLGNIEFSAEVEACLSRGATGVGLYRTEFLFLNAQTPPTEDEQFSAYTAVVESMKGRPVTIRTLDLGADKLAAFRDAGYLEANPVLGLRSLRLSLREPDLFRTQLWAILRASVRGDVRIMFPLVSNLTELRQAKAELDDVIAELKAQGIPIRENLPVGIMVEVPAAALMADHLAKEVDFFSIGTNETVAELYSAADPSVLRLITHVIRAAKERGIEVSVCGTMGGDPLYTLLLLGLGIRNLSMPPHQLPEIKRVIRGIPLETAQRVAEEALALDSPQAIISLLQETLRTALPDATPTKASTEPC
ncbi:MAG: phosphoenolpyruvate--protein phosphotransferase [Planctomycetes bacterium SCN 63-9]|nr:MAG: phosphoenolpyruvate--protein phosphotransferase [Planctomycetes bacterium SCN 63-9]